MIALISGTVAVRRGDHVVVDCGGVGYRLAVSAETLKHVPAAGRPVSLHLTDRVLRALLRDGRDSIDLRLLECGDRCKE